MAPYKDSSIITQAMYVILWFVWAIISIIYWLISWKKYTILKSIWMVVIWWFVWWGAGVLTNNTLVASFSWVLSLEIIHIIKEQWPQLFLEKIKKIFGK